MSNATPTPNPEPAAETAAEPVAATEQLATTEQPRPGVSSRWRPWRIPLLIAAAALLLGCALGAGVVAVGAFLVGGHGDDRGHSRDVGGNGRNGDQGTRDDMRGPGRGDHGDRTAPATPAAPAPSAVAPAPASTAPPAPAAS